MARHRQHSIVPLSRRSLIAVMTLTKIDKRGRLGSVLRSDLLGGIAGEMSPMRRLKLERAAQMTALAELARGDFMRDGKPTGQPAGARSPVRRHGSGFIGSSLTALAVAARLPYLPVARWLGLPVSLTMGPFHISPGWQRPKKAVWRERTFLIQYYFTHACAFHCRVDFLSDD